MIAIYISNSPVAVGTVVGSAPFNVCCITGGSALAVGGVLYLDPWLMGREVIGLMIPAFLFLVFLDDYLVEWWEALILVVYYFGIYVPCLTYFDSVKATIIRCFLFVLGGPTASTGDEVSIPQIGMAAPSYQNGNNSGLSSKDGKDDMRGSFNGLRGALAMSLSNTIAQSAKVTFEVPSQQATTQHLVSKRMTSQSIESGESLPSSLPATLPAISPELGAELMPVGFRLSSSPTLDAMLDLDVEKKVDVWESLVAECRLRCEGYSPDLGSPMKGMLLKKSRFYSKVTMTTTTPTHPSPPTHPPTTHYPLKPAC